MKEPAWIEHDGSAVCPVPAGHDVEVRFLKGAARDRDAPNWNWHRRCPNPITHYRDWTAFKQQEAMGKDYGLNCGDYAAAQEAMSNDVPNPPAFPVAPILPDIREGSDGMSLRDWFAGQALAGLLASRTTVFNGQEEKLAEWGFRHADAMLRARIPNIDSLAAAGEGE